MINRLSGAQVIPSYRSDVLKDRGESVARFDARFTRPQYELEEGFRDDASSDRYGAYYRAAVNGVIFLMMNIKLDRTYVTSWGKRNHITKKDSCNREETLGTTAAQLRSAMSWTPGLHVFFANGWFDMATYTGMLHYTLDHVNLSMDRVTVKHYASGHMIYTSEDNRNEVYAIAKHRAEKHGL